MRCVGAPRIRARSQGEVPLAEIAVPLAVAFVLGFGAQRVNLPPLVGYLLAGFALGGLGVEGSEALDLIADLGVLLLLFGIGLKLKPKTLARPVVWAGTSIHMVGWIALVTPVLLGLGMLGVPLVDNAGFGEALLVAFALSFSSTVFVVKTLEATNDESSLAGRVAIGTLVMQDVLAVVFLVAVGGVPSIWAIPIIAAVVALRPLWMWLLDRANYGELLLLFGLVLALGVGAAVFDAVGVKPDLGALLVGMLLASHPKAGDLASELLGFKDVLLIGFFLSIGLGDLPDGASLTVVALLLALLPLKTAGHLLLLPRFRLRARTVWHTSVTLAEYSEFGLIVVAVGVEEGLLAPAWATVLAVLIAVSFALAAPLNRRRYDLYARHGSRLEQLERRPVHPDDAVIDPGDATVLVFGMGRIGEGAYDELVVAQEGRVTGVDRSQTVVDRHQDAGRHVVRGDALDSEFWERVRLHPEVKLAVLATNEHAANLEAIRRLREHLPDVAVAAIASHAEEVDGLRDAGVTVARDLYEEAGQGLADDACAVVPGLRRTGETAAG